VNDLHRAVDEYVSIRRAVGFKLRGHDRLLHDFVGDLERSEGQQITPDMAAAWAVKTSTSPVRWCQRLVVLRGFTRHLNVFDPSVPVLPADLLVCRRERPTPYIYEEEEIAALLAATGSLRPKLHAATCRTLLGLIAATGMRLCEAIALDRADVDFAGGFLTIRRTKFNKTRRLPLHPSVLTALRDYATQRQPNRLFRKELKTTAFFISIRGTRLLDTCVHGVFRRLVEAVGLKPRAGSGRPRIHDLRHTFAVATVRDWHRSSSDAGAKAPLLSAYLGHAHPASTYWYLQAAPALLRQAAELLERPSEELP
jgi:integrase